MLPPMSGYLGRDGAPGRQIVCHMTLGGKWTYRSVREPATGRRSRPIATGSSSKCINASFRAAAADRWAGGGGRCMVTAQRPLVSCRERSSIGHSSRCLTSIQNAVGTATYSRPPLTRSRHIQNCQPSSSLPLMATASHSGEHSRCSTRMLRHETSRISALTHSAAHSMS